MELGQAGGFVFSDGCIFLVYFSTDSYFICAWAFVTMFALFSALKAAGILRVSAEEEQMGLDLSEHGKRAYGDS